MGNPLTNSTQRNGLYLVTFVRNSVPDFRQLRISLINANKFVENEEFVHMSYIETLNGKLYFTLFKLFKLQKHNDN